MLTYLLGPCSADRHKLDNKGTFCWWSLKDLKHLALKSFHTVPWPSPDERFVQGHYETAVNEGIRAGFSCSVGIKLMRNHLFICFSQFIVWI